MKKYKNLKVCFYLAPSKISGVGLFTRIKLKKGQSLEPFITDDSVIIKDSKDKYLLNKLCVKTKKGWGCPSDFSRPSFWWYINHSDNPNVDCSINSDFKVKKNLKPGYEITIDYKKLDECENNVKIKPGKNPGPKNFYQ